MQSSPSHVAILVPSVRKAADYLKSYGFQIGELETFSETREIYVNMTERNSLLLMEPKGPGSYQRALEKRGPGLHHLAIDVLDLEAYLASIAGSGWLLHMNSVKSIKELRTAYLARPGFPGLIEVQEKSELMPGPDFVRSIGIEFSEEHARLVTAIGLESIVHRASVPTYIQLYDQKITLNKMV